ncbi:MAG TPA: transcriptional repressor [Blastocatellia bacterium]|nr:transcriptional repressor [Blastocatellia bacterium]
MNVRNTKQRQAIFEAIERHGGHLTADEIYRLVKRRFPRLSLGTVYRNLRLLVAQADLRELDFGVRGAYFETTKDSHYHLICRVCGSIADADIPVERPLQSVVGQARNLGGFHIEEHRLDFIGVCAACQSEPGKPNRSPR